MASGSSEPSVPPTSLRPDTRRLTPNLHPHNTTRLDKPSRAPSACPLTLAFPATHLGISRHSPWYFRTRTFCQENAAPELDNPATTDDRQPLVRSNLISRAVRTFLTAIKVPTPRAVLTAEWCTGQSEARNRPVQGHLVALAIP
jgi:hypothetical protein